jgi:hypothetical protein
MQLVRILLCFEFACDESLEKVKFLMCRQLILEVFDLIELFQDGRDEESVGEESDQHEADEIDGLVHAPDVTQKSRY